MSIPQFLQHLISPCCPPHQPASYFAKHLKKPVSLSCPVDLPGIHPSQDVIAENSLSVASHTSTNLLAAQAAEDEDPSHSLSLSRPVDLPDIHSSQDVLTEPSLPVSFHALNNLLAAQAPGHSLF